MNKVYLLLPLLLISSVTYAYPPDNAAVLYYKHMEHFAKPDNAVWDEITDLRTSGKPASQEARAFIQKQKDNGLIPELLDASQLQHCDWGLDLSRGFEMLMPGLSNIKNFHYLLLADSAIHASEGNLTAAIEKNLAVRRMAQHVSNDTLIGFLVSMSISRSSNEALTHLLSTYAVDHKTLTELKNELLLDIYQPKSIRHPLMMEKEVVLIEVSKMTPQRYQQVLGMTEGDVSDQRIQKILTKSNNDPAFQKRSADFVEKYYDKIFTLMEKPYPQSYLQIQKAMEKVTKLAEENDEAVLTAIFCPALGKCYNMAVTWKTDFSAMMTALDLYLIAAKTGKLPQTLPESKQIDHFSGKPFLYEITDNGFTLRCQQEDLVKKTIHEFKYKLPK